MWPYGAAERPLGQQAPTYADRLEAHWRALPFGRKLEILLYLARRPFRHALREIAAFSAECAQDFRRTLRQWGRSFADAAATLRWAQTPEGRYAIADFLESLATVRAAKEAAPILALAIVLVLLAGLDNDRVQNSSEHLSIVEAARLARDFRPPPCYLVDGEVWIDAEGGPLYPGRRGYRESRRDICGF